MIQWTPGATEKHTDDPKWWPLYHKTIDAGKKVLAGCHSLDGLRAMKQEFGPKLKQFLIPMSVNSPKEAEEALRIAEVRG